MSAYRLRWGSGWMGGERGREGGMDRDSLGVVGLEGLSTQQQASRGC